MGNGWSDRNNGDIQVEVIDIQKAAGELFPDCLEKGHRSLVCPDWNARLI